MVRKLVRQFNERQKKCMMRNGVADYLSLIMELVNENGNGFSVYIPTLKI